MDLRDSPEEAAFRAEVRAFLEANAPRDLPDYYDDQVDHEAFLARSRAWQRTLYDAHWASITWPVEYGGRGLGPVQQIIWNQEQGRAGIGESLSMVGVSMAGPTLIAHGTDAQRQRYRAPMRRGDEMWCQLFSEPGAGSDLGSLATRAVREGDDWVVNGQKTWCTGGHYGDFGILSARTDPSLPTHPGITYFVRHMKTPGVEVRPLRDMTGMAHFNEVFLNDVRIPDANRVGPENGGWGVAMTTLMNERMAMGGLERMIPLAELMELANPEDAPAGRPRAPRLPGSRHQGGVGPPPEPPPPSCPPPPRRRCCPGLASPQPRPRRGGSTSPAQPRLSV